MGYKVHTVDGKAGEVDLTHTRKRSVSLTVPSPAAANHVVWRATAACHVTRVSAYTTGGTSTTVNASTTGGDVLTTNLVAAAGSWVSHTADQNAALAADGTLTIKVTAAAGTPTECTIQVDYTVDIPA